MIRFIIINNEGIPGEMALRRRPMLIPSTTPHHPPDSAQPTEHRLTRLLRPRRVALVGGSDRSNWSNRIYDALQVIGYDGDVYLVNPKGGQAHGRPLHRTVGDIGTVPDVAFLMVPGPAVLDAMRDAAVAGVKAAVVLSSGFA